MKPLKRTLPLFLAALFLFSCQKETPASSKSQPSAPSSVLEPTSSSTVDAHSSHQNPTPSSQKDPDVTSSSQEPTVETLTLSSSDEIIKDNESGDYPADYEAKKEGYTFAFSKVMRGGGDYQGSIQMRKSNAYITLLEGWKGKFEATFKTRVTAQGDFTGTPTFSEGSGDSFVALENVEKKEDEASSSITYSASLTGEGSFRLDTFASKNAMYLLSLSFKR